MGKQHMVGVLAAIFSAFAWSLGFIAPYVIGPYSIYDLAICRYLISGVIAFGILLAAWLGLTIGKVQLCAENLSHQACEALANKRSSQSETAGDRSAPAPATSQGQPPGPAPGVPR